MEAIETPESGRVDPENHIDTNATTTATTSPRLPAMNGKGDAPTDNSATLPTGFESQLIQNGDDSNTEITEPNTSEAETTLSLASTKTVEHDIGAAAHHQGVGVDEPIKVDGIDDVASGDTVPQDSSERQQLNSDGLVNAEEIQTDVSPQLHDVDITTAAKTEDAVESSVKSTEATGDDDTVTTKINSETITVTSTHETSFALAGDLAGDNSEPATGENLVSEVPTMSIPVEVASAGNESKTRGDKWTTFDDDETNKEKAKQGDDTWLPVGGSNAGDTDLDQFAPPAIATTSEDGDENESHGNDKGSSDGAWIDFEGMLSSVHKANEPIATEYSARKSDNYSMYNHSVYHQRSRKVISSVITSRCESRGTSDHTTDDSIGTDPRFTTSQDEPQPQGLHVTGDHEAKIDFEESLDIVAQPYEKLDSSPSSQRQSMGETEAVAAAWMTFDDDSPRQKRKSVGSGASDSQMHSPPPTNVVASVAANQQAGIPSETKYGRTSQSGHPLTSLSGAGGLAADPFGWQTSVTAGSQNTSLSAQLELESSHPVSGNTQAKMSSDQSLQLTNSSTRDSLQSMPTSPPLPVSAALKGWVSFDDDAGTPTKKTNQSLPPEQPQHSVFFGNSFQQQQAATQHIGTAGNPFTKELLATQHQQVQPVNQFQTSPTVQNATAPSSPYNPFQSGAVGGNVQVTQPPTSPSFNPFAGSATVQDATLIAPTSPGNPFRMDSSMSATGQATASPYASGISALDASSQQPAAVAAWSSVSSTATQPPTGYPNVALAETVQLEAALPKQEDVPVFEEMPVLDEDGNCVGDRFDDEYPLEPYDPLKGWDLELRVPDRKKLTGSRYWKPVRVRLIDGNVLQLYNDNNPMEPFRELPLQSSYMFSVHKRQPYSAQGKIHTIKVEYVSYKEKKKFGSKYVVEHLSHRAELLKVGSTDYREFKSFIRAVNDTLMRLPAHRDRGTTYRQDSITIDVTDKCRARLTKNGETDKVSISVHILCLAFVTGMPECVLGLNDFHRQGVEIVSRQDIIPHRTDSWVKMENVELHSCVDQEKFISDRFIEFHPLDASTFELMRFQIRPDKGQDLPLIVKVVVSGERAHIELRADVLIPGHRSKKSMQQNPTENIMICFPIPESWVPMFRIAKKFGYKSVKSTTKKAGKIKKGSLCPGLIEVSAGTAKYEHAYRSLVWRIPRLPEKNTDPHTTQIFMCRMDLTSENDIPHTYNKYALVEYTMPNTTASRTAVRSIAVANERIPDKLVRYRAHYSYEAKVYQTVIEDVINNVREAFLDEGVDEQVLQELKHIWDSKLAQSKALEQPSDQMVAVPQFSSHQGSNPTQVNHPYPVSVQRTDQLGSTISASAQQAAMALPEGIIPVAYQHQPLTTVTLPTSAGSGTQTYPAYQVTPITQATNAQGASQLVYQQVPIQTVGAIQTQHGTQPTIVQQHIHQAQPGQPQQHQTQQIIGQVQSTVPNQAIIQVDGGNDTSSDEEDDEYGGEGKEDEDDDDDDEENEDNDAEGVEDEEPLNSGDDVDDEDPAELFDTENVVVCQYDKINRSRNKWKFHLKDGIMNLKGKDYVFQKAIGDAEW
ncbi:stonin-2-like [Ptychodera flava]|uniref:stonin-2-like n=1 Tax=Ptychodera flava TaxID=63121 RepID=UPI00396A3A8B